MQSFTNPTSYSCSEGKILLGDGYLQGIFYPGQEDIFRWKFINHWLSASRPRRALGQKVSSSFKSIWVNIQRLYTWESLFFCHFSNLKSLKNTPKTLLIHHQILHLISRISRSPLEFQEYKSSRKSYSNFLQETPMFEVCAFDYGNLPSHKSNYFSSPTTWSLWILMVIL